MFKYNGKRKEKNNSVNFLVFANWLNTQLLRTIVVVVFTSGRRENTENLIPLMLYMISSLLLPRERRM